MVIKNLSNENRDDAHYRTNAKASSLFIQKLIHDIDSLASAVGSDPTVLISVKHQKILRTCFQLLTTLGMAPCMIPGVGINPSKRCATSALIPQSNLTDEEKYDLLVECTEFLMRCYSVPVLKKIIITLHLSDYLAALIQLAFAPLKKPGIYQNFIMTQEMYDKLTHDRQKYVGVYDELVANCFQPLIMKELLVLQSVCDPPPPMFVKRVITKELSRRLLSPGGLLSLIRCFIETHSIDTGYEWKKIDMICRIVSAKHGTGSENDYLENISNQIKQILLLNNTHYLTTAVGCTVSLNEKFPQSPAVRQLAVNIFQALNSDSLSSKSQMPGTIVLSPEEVDHSVNILNSCVCSVNINWSIELLSPSLGTLFLLGLKCMKNQEMKLKIRDVLLKCLAACSKSEFLVNTRIFLFGKKVEGPHITVEEFEAGLAIKCVDCSEAYPSNEAVLYYLEILKMSTDNTLVATAFETSLKLLLELTALRQNRGNRDLLTLEDNTEILQDTDHQYALTLQLLSEMSTLPKVIASLKETPTPVLNFIEHFLLKSQENDHEECVTIALVLLNTILSSANKSILEKQFSNLTPVLRKMAREDSTFNNILCKEALALMSSQQPAKAESPCERALANVFDDLLPVRAHGVIELTRLIDAKDPETISKKHYVFVIFQVKLKVFVILQKRFMYLRNVHV